METLHQILQDNNIISEESKEKVCIIEDIVKHATLVGYTKPTVEEFDMLYDMPLDELQVYQHFLMEDVRHRQFMDQMHRDLNH